MTVIIGSKSWELHVIGEMPPGIDPQMMEATVVASYAIVGTLLPFVRGQFVQLHNMDAETLKRQLAQAIVAQSMST
jgi:hypothetical protein